MYSIADIRLNQRRDRLTQTRRTLRDSLNLVRLSIWYFDRKFLRPRQWQDCVMNQKPLPYFLYCHLNFHDVQTIESQVFCERGSWCQLRKLELKEPRSVRVHALLWDPLSQNP